MSSSVPKRGHVLITGASTGIGRACAAHLAHIGFEVFAGVRKDVDAQAIDAEGRGQVGGGSLCAIKLDVTDESSIATAVSHIQSVAGADGLKAVVNNAGVSFPGPVEFLSIADWRRQFEVNFFGQIAVTQAALPLLRRHVTSRGKGAARLMLMSSIAGKVGQPILGAYTASKFALESLGDSLRLELQRQGVQVCLVEPGAIDTPIWKKAEAAEMMSGAAYPGRALYGPEIDAVLAYARSAAISAAPVGLVSAAVEQCLVLRRPRPRYVVGRAAKIGAVMRRIMPDRIFDAMLSRAIKLPR